MPTTPRISVIIAVYNGAVHLVEQMDALLAQNCDFPWEAIYVDNGSRDQSREIIRSRITKDNLAHVRLVDGSQKAGQVYARNIGAAAALADLLAFTDQDDLPAPGWLAAMFTALVGSADAAGGFVVRTPDGYPPAADRNELPAHDRLLLRWHGIDCAIGTNFAVHRNVFAAIGGWQDVNEIHAGEDIDICIRLQEKGYRLTYVPGARVTWRSRSGLRNIWRQAFVYGRCDVQLYVRYRRQLQLRRSGRLMLRKCRQALHSLSGLFHTPRDLNSVHRLGWLAGALYESVRSRTFYL